MMRDLTEIDVFDRAAVEGAARIRYVRVLMTLRSARTPQLGLLLNITRRSRLKRNRTRGFEAGTAREAAPNETNLVNLENRSLKGG